MFSVPTLPTWSSDHSRSASLQESLQLNDGEKSISFQVESSACRRISAVHLSRFEQLYSDFHFIVYLSGHSFTFFFWLFLDLNSSVLQRAVVIWQRALSPFSTLSDQKPADSEEPDISLRSWWWRPKEELKTNSNERIWPQMKVVQVTFIHLKYEKKHVFVDLESQIIA